MAGQSLSSRNQELARPRSQSMGRRLWRGLFFKRGIYGILFVAPAMLFFLIFNLYPMITGLYLSLTDFTLLNPPQFVGGENFVGLLTNKEFLNALWVTFVFVIGTTVPKWIISLALALLFTRTFWGREGFKVLYFTPTLLSGVVVSLVWKLIFHANGIASAIITPYTNQSEIFWLANSSLTPMALMIVDNWSGIPFFMIVWIAGLVGIPREFYEAALIDGAGRCIDVEER